jgi:ribosomal-protein-alanine N-acetyltransferase
MTTWPPSSRSPRLTTDRLILRPFFEADAEDVARLAGDRLIAATTLRIPHPYELHDAKTWLATHAESWVKGRGVNWAIERLEDRELIGTVGLDLDLPHERAMMGYWIGHPFWRQGYGTEAAGAAMRYAFVGLGMHRVDAHALAGNEYSIRILTRIGMLPEGTWRDFVKKWGTFHDVHAFAMLRDDFDAMQRKAGE